MSCRLLFKTSILTMHMKWSVNFGLNLWLKWNHWDEMNVSNRRTDRESYLYRLTMLLHYENCYQLAAIWVRFLQKWTIQTMVSVDVLEHHVLCQPSVPLPLESHHSPTNCNSTWSSIYSKQKRRCSYIYSMWSPLPYLDMASCYHSSHI
jgi:hypothetical protein